MINNKQTLSVDIIHSHSTMQVITYVPSLVEFFPILSPFSVKEYWRKYKLDFRNTFLVKLFSCINSYPASSVSVLLPQPHFYYTFGHIYLHNKNELFVVTTIFMCPWLYGQLLNSRLDNRCNYYSSILV
jgi:hypothetical protein